MGGEGDHGDTGFSYFHAAQAMDERDAGDGMGGGDFVADLRHQLNGHGFIALVIEEAGGTAFGIVADDSFEVDEGAVVGLEQLAGEGGDVERLAGEAVEVAFRLGGDLMNPRSGAAADGRKQRDFIAIGERGGGGGEFLIAGEHDAALQLDEGREAGGEMIEHVADGRVGGQFERGLGLADDIP